MRARGRNASFAHELRLAERRAQMPYGFRGPMGGGMGGGKASFTGNWAALAVSFGLTVRSYFVSHLGRSGTTGTGITNLANQAGDASAWTPGTGASNGIGAAGTGLGGKSSIIADGATQCPVYTLSGVKPSIVTQHNWGIARFLATPASNAYLFGDSIAGMVAYVASGQTPPAAAVTQYNAGGVGGSVATVINQWYEYLVSFTGSAADQVIFGSHVGVPTVTNDTAPVGARGYFANGAGANKLNGEFQVHMNLDGPAAAALAFAVAAGPLAKAYYAPSVETIT